MIPANNQITNTIIQTAINDKSSCFVDCISHQHGKRVHPEQRFLIKCSCVVLVGTMYTEDPSRIAPETYKTYLRESFLAMTRNPGKDEIIEGYINEIFTDPEYEYCIKHLTGNVSPLWKIIGVMMQVLKHEYKRDDWYTLFSTNQDEAIFKNDNYTNDFYYIATIGVYPWANHRLLYNFESDYLWGWSSVYTKGAVIDGEYLPDHVSDKIGIFTILNYDFRHENKVLRNPKNQ